MITGPYTQRSRLPAGIQRELDAAVQRTGWTDALRCTDVRLPILLNAEPWQVEYILYLFSEPYDAYAVFEEMEETVETN